ncbi:zinc finger CCCH domain-containing protein 14-like [Centruroides sculpturatus]|uniref:zinc finger CCCH domain-containing protein 14-like n=1 Tax=Centruroides sculpturatus TaxID=218467 RepID=UPI000C6F006B|nr:zinc finger CCCH domain-containing protein 14-like [Centruroides sculpturatus]
MRVFDSRVEPYKPTPIRQLFARNHKQLVPISLTNVEQLAEEENLSDFDLDANDPQDQDTRTVVSCTDKHQLKNQKLENDDDDEDDDVDIEKENESELFTKKTKIASVDVKSKARSDRKRKLEDIEILENTENAPHFVVTLDGVDPSKFLRKKQRRNVVTNKVPLSPDVSKFELDELEELSTKEICQTDEAEEIIEEEMMDESMDEKIQERCRYWPACKRGDNCEYHHPTIPCK